MSLMDGKVPLKTMYFLPKNFLNCCIRLSIVLDSTKDEKNYSSLENCIFLTSDISNHKNYLHHLNSITVVQGKCFF